MIDPSDEEPSTTEHTSTKLRTAIPKALAHFGRPISAHEFESWISANDAALWHEVSSKCYDYVRMILSLTKPQFLAKYKCSIPPPGNDKRAAFYGIPDSVYGSNWTKINPPRRKSRRTKRRVTRQKTQHIVHNPICACIPDEQHHYQILEDDDNDTFFFDAQKLTTNSPSPNEYVSDQMALDCWKILSDNYQFGNQIWSQLLRALSTAKERSSEAKTPPEIAREIAAQYNVIRNSEVIDRILMIIQREIIINREMEANSI